MDILNVLIIDSSPDDTFLMISQLCEAGYDVSSSRVETKEEMMKALSERKWHLILCDYAMPNFNGLQALEIFKEAQLDIPFIVVSGAIGEEAVVELMKSGAHNYVAKGNPGRLAPTVKRELREARLRLENRLARDVVRENQKLFGMLIEASGDSFILVGVNQNTILYANDIFLNMMGYNNLEEIQGMPFLTVIHPDDHQFVDFSMGKVRTTESQSSLYECRGVRKDGVTITLEVSIVLIANIKGDKFVIHIRDITNRKEEEKKQNRLFNFSIDMLSVSNFDGYLKQLNPAWTRSLGWSYGELTTRPFLEFVHPQDKLNTMDAVYQIMEGNTVSPFECRFLTKHGSYRWLLWSMYLVPNEAAIFSVVSDVTEKKATADKMERTVKELKKNITAVIDIVARLVEARDPYTSGHQKKVGKLAASIAREMGLSQNHVDAIHMAGSIHDLGKISIPAEILSMPRKLTEVEFSFVKTHPKAGYDILKNVRFEWPIADIIYEHHERMDGSGYPRGLTGENIRLESRIIAVADVVEAIESNRPYRTALGREAALDEITKNRGVYYDQNVVDACLHLYREKGFDLEKE